MAARGAASTVLALAENLPKIVDKSSLAAAQDVNELGPSNSNFRLRRDNPELVSLIQTATTWEYGHNGGHDFFATQKSL